MDYVYQTDEAVRVAEARASYAGRLLTDRQFNDFMSITGIVERRIQETGSFRECMKDYASAAARTERFDAAKADGIIRDLFKARTGITMNEMRTQLLEREEQLLSPENEKAQDILEQAYESAIQAGQAVEHGNMLTFFRALNFEAVNLANSLEITHVGAKKLIETSFQKTENRPLREWGEELNRNYYRPQIEAQKSARTRQFSFSGQQPSYT